MASKKIKKQVVFVLDETGSMMSVKNETVSGFNEYIQTLQDDDDGSMRFNLVKFNDCEITEVYNGVKIAKVEELTLENYNPQCSTPLYDVIGKTITDLKTTLDKKKNQPSVLFVIMTDGYENSSTEYSHDAVKRLIEEREKEDNWAFVFLGANMDAPAYAKSMGMDVTNASTYDASDPLAAYRVASVATRNWSNSDGERVRNLVDTS